MPPPVPEGETVEATFKNLATAPIANEAEGNLKCKRLQMSQPQQINVKHP